MVENTGTQPPQIPKPELIFLTFPMFEDMPDHILIFLLDKIKKGEALIVINGPMEVM